MESGLELIESKKSDIRLLCQSLGVEKLYTFGSINTSSFSEASDLGFLVKFKHEEYGEEYLALADSLQKVLHKKIDLVTFQQVSNPYFIAELNKTKKLIYGA
jgi:predicted nucleotidyltransferase